MFSSRFPTQRTLIIVVLFLASVLLFTGCSLPWQHSNAAANSPKPTTKQLLATLQKNFRNVSAFHVTMQVNNPGKAITNGIQLLNANGDIVMPDKVKAQATVVLSGQSITVNLISIANNQFITDRKSTRLNSSHVEISYAVFCLKKKKKKYKQIIY